MNAKTLKIIAIVTMTIDHIGYYLLPETSEWYLVTRIIGRIAFPLFAFFIAEGYWHSHDRTKYLVRLMDFAAMFEAIIIGYYLASGVNLIFKVNILWTLAAGLLCLILLNRQEIYFKLLVIPLVIGVELLKLQYGAYGIGLILIFGFIRKLPWRVLAMAMFTLFFVQIPLFQLIGLDSYARYQGYSQWFSLIALVLIAFYNGQKGTFNRYFFYFYYPAHLILIYSLSLLI